MNAKSQKGKTSNVPKKRRWIWPVLIISLALNLLFVGLVAGRMWARGGSDRAPHRVVAAAVTEFAEDLPAAKQKRANELLQAHREKIRKIRKELHEARRAARDAMIADPYDGANFENTLTRLRELRKDRHESMHTMVLALLTDLTLEERKKLLKRVRAGFRRGVKHRGPRFERRQENGSQPRQ